MTTTAIARLMAAIRSRRALLGNGLAALALAVDAQAERDVAARKLTNRQRRRRRRRRNRGGGGPAGGVDCQVCESMSDGRNCRFTSIQAAIDAIPEGSGGTLAVCAGTFQERLTIPAFRAQNLTIEGAGPQSTTIDADGDGSAITIARGAFLEIQGFTITGGKADFGGGIVNQGFLTINNCVVTDNDTGAAEGGGGGIYNNGGNLTLQLTQVLDNASLDGQGGGILNAGGRLALQESTLVTKNQAEEGGGIFNQGGGTVTVDSSSGVTDNEPNNCVGTTACSA